MLRRRRRATIVTVVLAVVPAIVLLVSLLIGDLERIVGYHLVARVDAAGTARIDEVIDYDFGAGNQRHGIYRVVPSLSEASGIQVSSPTAPDQIQLSPGRVRIGHPDTTVDGTHRYEIGYSLDTLVAGDALAWNVVGTEWDVGIESVDAYVVSERALGDLTCDRGSFGETGGCEAVAVADGVVRVVAEDLDAGEAVTVRATLGDVVAPSPGAVPDAPPFPGETGAPIAMPVLWGFVLAAAAGLLTGQVLRRAGREEAPVGWTGGGVVVPPGTPEGTVRADVADLVADLAPRVAPPRRLTPAEGGVLLTEKVTSDHQAAWLLDQAHGGAVALEGDPQSPTLRWLGGAGAERTGPLLTMFDTRDTVDLGAYDQHFSAGWRQVQGELDAWRRASGLWSAAGERRRRWAIGIGLAVALVGLADVVLFGYRWAQATPAVWSLALLTVPVGIGIGLLTRAFELRVRTAEGSALYQQVEGFRRYLAAAEAPDVDRAAEAGLVHEHLAWAVALGVSDRWVEAVEGSSVASSPGYDPGMFLMAAHLHSSTSSAATAPSSSSGGGGGGAGGGGGGGGGGSW